jgi:hypothetical protein
LPRLSLVGFLNAVGAGVERMKGGDACVALGTGCDSAVSQKNLSVKGGASPALVHDYK